jgi:hypothetical protein
MDYVQLANRPIPKVLPPDNDLGDGLMVMTWVMLAASTVLVAARMASKIMLLKRFRLDDIFLLLTWVSPTTSSAHDRLRPANISSDGRILLLNLYATRVSQRLRSTFQ